MVALSLILSWTVGPMKQGHLLDPQGLCSASVSRPVPGKLFTSLRDHQVWSLALGNVPLCSSDSLALQEADAEGQRWVIPSVEWRKFKGQHCRDLGSCLSRVRLCGRERIPVLVCLVCSVLLDQTS